MGGVPSAAFTRTCLGRALDWLEYGACPHQRPQQLYDVFLLKRGHMRIVAADQQSYAWLCR